MKLIWSLALVALAMAALTPALSSAVPVADGAPLCIESSPIPMATDFGSGPGPSYGPATDFTTDFDDFDRRCLQFCSRVLCANPQTCGVYTNSSGQRACGCH